MKKNMLLILELDSDNIYSKEIMSLPLLHLFNVMSEAQVVISFGQNCTSLNFIRTYIFTLESPSVSSIIKRFG